MQDAAQPVLPDPDDDEGFKLEAVLEEVIEGDPLPIDEEDEVAPDVARTDIRRGEAASSNNKNHYFQEVLIRLYPHASQHINWKAQIQMQMPMLLSN